MLLGYSIIDTFDFTNAAGVKISSKPIHNIHIEPGVRFIANLNGGWRPYISASMIWNALDKAKFMADDVALPETSIKPYVKYGVGVQKSWSPTLNSYVQTYLTHGGRNGVGLLKEYGVFGAAPAGEYASRHGASGGQTPTSAYFLLP